MKITISFQRTPSVRISRTPNHGHQDCCRLLSCSKAAGTFRETYCGQNTHTHTHTALLLIVSSSSASSLLLLLLPSLSSPSSLLCPRHHPYCCRFHRSCD